LPQDTFKINGLAINAQYLPTGRVGGDLYDIVPLDDHRTAVLLVDVAGHGVPAALISAMAKLSFSRHIHKGISPQEIFQCVNNELVHYMPPERFVTAILGIIDTQNMEFTYVRAANPPALLCHKETNICDYLATTGTFIGLFPDVQFEQKSEPIRRGDKIVMFTDGLIECTDDQGKQFGKIKLENTVSSISSLNAKEFNLEIINRIKNYTTGLPQSDDVTMVTVEMT
jgi:serine phosphatase RsbU (regulator of sigma subunit)